jgi:hypothetical protein
MVLLWPRDLVHNTEIQPILDLEVVSGCSFFAWSSRLILGRVRIRSSKELRNMLDLATMAGTIFEAAK